MKLIFLFYDDILTIHTKFCAILMVSVDKPNTRPDIQPYFGIDFYLSQVVQNDIIHTYVEFHANLFNIKKVNKPDIRPDTRIITKI